MAISLTVTKGKKSKADKATPAKGDKPSKSKGKAPPKHAAGAGVIGSIVEFLQAASAKAPLSKADLLAKLVKRFPDRGEDAMRKTINCQLPTRLVAEKGLKIEKNEDGYWIK